MKILGFRLILFTLALTVMMMAESTEQQLSNNISEPAKQISAEGNAHEAPIFNHNSASTKMQHYIANHYKAFENLQSACQALVCRVYVLTPAFANQSGIEPVKNQMTHSTRWL